MKVGSLFSGIGGIDLGLERAGFEIVWQVEINEYRQKVLGKRFPNAVRYGDVRTVGKHNLAPVNLICGGFPCQPHSLAGRRRGSGDERNLWPEFYRVLCELRPAWVLAENVPGLLSSDDGRFFGGILRDLAALRYDAEWQVLSAEAFGAPHLRERVFLVGYSMRLRCGRARVFDNTGPLFSERGQDERAMADTTSTGLSIRRQSWLSTYETQARAGLEYQLERCSEDVADADRQSLAVGQVFGNYATTELAAFKRSCSEGTGIWATEPDVGRMAHGIPARVDRLSGLGDSVVSQIAEYIGRCILEANPK